MIQPLKAGQDAGMEPVAIKNASSIILVRSRADRAQVLMGQRGKTAAFMPDKFVFPGGAVDPGDADVTLWKDPHDACLRRLGQDAPPALVHGLLTAAIRELWEEAGLILGTPGRFMPPNDDWRSFAATGHAPDASALRYVFRAITPPGRPRRFDARFFMANVNHIAGNCEDFSAATDELSHLHWVDLRDARKLNLPFITEVILAEVAGLMKAATPPESVPVFDNTTDISHFRRIT